MVANVVKSKPGALRVLSNAIQSKAGTSRLAIAVPAGPIYENEWNAGISHVMRRLAYRDNFVSSSWRTEWNLSNAGLHLSNNGHGADLLARQFLIYSVVGPSETVLQEGVLSHLAQMVFFPRFHQRDIAMNEDFIKSELKYLKQKNPIEYVKEKLWENAFDGPLSNSIFCPDHNLKWANSTQLWNWWQKHFSAANVRIVATNANTQVLQDLISQNEWLNMSHQTATESPAVEASKYTGGEYTSIHRRELDWDEQFSNVSDTWTGVALKAPAAAQREKYIIGLVVKAALDNEFGGVDTDGASAAKVSYDAAQDGGLFTIVFTNFNGKGVDNKQLHDKVKRALTNAIEKKEYFQAAVNAARRETAERLGCSNSGLNELILASLYDTNSSHPISKLVSDVASVSHEAFVQVAQDAIKSNPTFVYYGGKPVATS